jgi:hypothetical protein
LPILQALFVASLVNFLVLLAVRRRYEPALASIVAATYCGTVLLRYLLALYLWMNRNEPGLLLAFWGDSQTYDYFGAALAESWSLGHTIQSWTYTIEGGANRGFIYFVAAIYYVFGRNVLLVQFVNGIIGALTSLVIFEIGLLLYDRRVATTAMLFTAFFPQMIFWSAALYKDPTVMLCIATNILAVFRLRNRLQFIWVLMYLLTAGALVWLRFYIFYAVLAATMAGMVVRHRRGMRLGLASQMALVTGVIIVLLYTPVGQEALLQSRFLDLDLLQNSRADLARAGSGFAANVDVSSLSGVISVLPLGVLYLLFAPFPWMIRGLRQAFALPDILMWYALVPFLVIGIGLALRRLRQTMPILVFTTALTIAYGAFLGNAGTAYRQRTQIMMFYFLFIADGIHRRRRGAAETSAAG